MSDIQDYAAPLPNGGLDQTVSQAHEEFLRLVTVPVLVNERRALSDSRELALFSK